MIKQIKIIVQFETDFKEYFAKKNFEVHKFMSGFLVANLIELCYNLVSSIKNIYHLKYLLSFYYIIL